MAEKTKQGRKDEHSGRREIGCSTHTANTRLCINIRLFSFVQIYIAKMQYIHNSHGGTTSQPFGAAVR